MTEVDGTRRRHGVDGISQRTDLNVYLLSLIVLTDAAIVNKQSYCGNEANDVSLFLLNQFKSDI